MLFRKIFLILCLIAYCTSPVPVLATTEADYLSIIEKNLFNTQFQNETITNRLNRIEKTVFGTTSNASSDQRMANLQKALGNIDNKAIKYKNEPNIQSKRIISQSKQISSNYNKKLSVQNTKNQYNSDPFVKYPVIDEIESKVLNKNYQQEDIYKRLSRLESTIFDREFNEPLNERVERLKETVLGTNKNKTALKSTENYDNSHEINPQTINSLLNEMEKQVFNTTYPYDTTDQRLSRLENKIFNDSSPDDSISDRLERLTAVIAAEPSNELYRDMSQLRQYQNITTGLTATAVLLMLLKGLLF